MNRTLSLLTILTTALFPLKGEDKPVDLGTRLELLLDDHLFENAEGLEWRLHKPEARDVVITCDAPWEGNTSAYFTILEDAGLFRMYYRGSHSNEETKKAAHRELTCYAESRDGIQWTKPNLGLFEYEGSKDNNIICWEDGTHNFSPFLDTNPDCPPESRYKALASGRTEVDGAKKPCLNAYHSADGIRWHRTREEPVITAGAFDSQNIAFYDESIGAYRAYWRYFTKGHTDERGWKPQGVRAIRTATSKDFMTWENQSDLTYESSPDEHLYTNAVRPYFRAPHIYLGFPTRYQPTHQQVEPVFMSSRDGIQFRRWAEEIIPITAPEERDGNRANYMTHGLLQLPDQEGELSVYATERYYTGPGSRVRRFVYRTDGFVSASSAGKGELLTRPLTFSGGRLFVNLVSRGQTRFELQDKEGRAIPGYTLADCNPVEGDHLSQAIQWAGGDLSAFAGQILRLRASLENADWYSFRFGDE